MRGFHADSAGGTSVTGVRCINHRESWRSSSQSSTIDVVTDQSPDPVGLSQAHEYKELCERNDALTSFA